MKSVLVTGGASGIGWSIASAFAAQGYGVVILDRHEPETALPDAVHAVVADVCDPAANEAAVARALAEFGRLDVFVGNAGVHDGGAGIGDLSGNELASLTRRVLDIDVVGYVLGAQAAESALSQTSGTMIFTLSDASYLAQGNGAGIAYTAAKHAGLGVVRYLAAHLAPRIRVNAVAPGGVATGLQAIRGDGGSQQVYADPEPILDQVRRLNPLQVALTPDELAQYYLFLAGDAAGAMTGEVLRPDGGLSVR